MKQISLKDVYIKKHVDLKMPYANAVQTAWQDGDITALQLHNKTTYLFRQNLNSMHDNMLEFGNNSLLKLSGNAYGHTQSLVHAQRLFSGNWIYVGSGPDTYDSKSETWGLDIMRFDGDGSATYDSNNLNKMTRLTGFDHVLTILQSKYGIEQIGLKRVEFSMSSTQSAIILLFDTNNNTYFIRYLMDDISNLMNKDIIASAQNLKMYNTMFVPTSTWEYINKIMGASSMISIQGLALGDDHAIYLSSEFAPKDGIQQPRALIKINNFNNDYTSNNWTLINLTNVNKFDQYNDQHSAKLLTEFEGIYLDTMRPNNNVYQIIAYHDPTDANKTIKNIIWHIIWEK